LEQSFSGRYSVKVADLCYVLIGQIVNRQLLPLRYQASAGLVVNSPIQAPVLAEKVRRDWGSADAEALKGSLVDDIHGANHRGTESAASYTESVVNPALARLRFYFPDTYAALKGADLKKRIEFEKHDAERRQTAETR
jgi:hypothetical protein